jgi:hemoglobin/transferrin/lactoferrin receptor protein
MKKRFLAVLIPALAPSIFVSTAQASDAPTKDPALREVVVSATRVEQDVHEVANTITSIDAETIERQMVIDVKDMMRYEAGVSVRAEPNRASAVFRATGRSGNEGINIRGLEGDQVLLQVDGVRLPMIYASGPYAAGRADYIDPEAYKRVEILRGPSSTQFGSDGLSGAVSFITKDPTDLLTLGKPWQGSVKLGYASVDKSWSVVPSYAYAGDSVEAMLLASLRRGHETDNMGNNNAADFNRTTPNPADAKSDYLLGKLVLKPNRRHKIKLGVEDLDRDIDTDVLSFFGDPFTVATLTNVDVEERISRRQYKLDYEYTHGDNPWFQRATASLYKQESKNDQWGLEERSTDPVLRWRDTLYAEDMFGGSLQFESHFGDQVAHRLVYGMDASQTEVSSFKDGFNSSGTAFVPNKSFPDTDYQLFGAFIQDEIKIGQFSVIPGLRYDRFKLDPKPDAFYLVNNTVTPSKLSDHELSPKLGVIWDLDPMANVFASYAHGFRAPKPSQVNGGVTNLTATNPYTSIGNPDLKPETSDTIELGIRGRGKVLRYSASLFKGKYKDFIAGNVLVEDNVAPTLDVFQSVNLNDVEISGYELRGEWTFAPDWQLSASYAHAKGDSTDAGVSTPLETIDPDKLVLGLRYDRDEKFGGKLMLTAAERKKRNPDPAARYNPAGYAVADLTGYYRVNKQLTVNAGVFNLFDKKYFNWSDVRNLTPTYGQVDAYSQPGRNFSVSMKMDF